MNAPPNGEAQTMSPVLIQRLSSYTTNTAAIQKRIYDDDDSTGTTPSPLSMSENSAREDAFPSTYRKPVLLSASLPPQSPSQQQPRRTGSADSYDSSEAGTSTDGGSPEGGAAMTEEMDGPPQDEEQEGEDEEEEEAFDAPTANDPTPSPPPRDKRPSPTLTLFTTPPTTPPASSSHQHAPPSSPSAGGTHSLPTSPDLAQAYNYPHPRRPFALAPVLPSPSVPSSPIHGRRQQPRPNMLGSLPQNSSMRVSPAVLLTPAVSLPLPRFPLPTPAGFLVPATLEDREQEARRAKRAVPVLMSPRGEVPHGRPWERSHEQEQEQEQEGEEEGGTSEGSSDESEGEEGTSTEEGEGDAKSTHSSSEGSTAMSSREGLVGGVGRRGRRRERGSGGSTEGLLAAAREEPHPVFAPAVGGGEGSRDRAGGMPSLAQAMAPLGLGLGITLPPMRRPGGADETPKPGQQRTKSRERDYFSAWPPPASPQGTERSPLQTPRPRPGLYQQVSQSLVDLGGAGKPVPMPAITASAAPSTSATKLRVVVDHPPDPVVALAPPIPPPYNPIKRRTSLPSINPPPYTPAHHLLAPPSAREEEGREPLPTYTCAVHIEGTLQRKMEFSAPGVQAKDRSWKRYWFELHGTGLRVFRQDLRRVGCKGYQAWDGRGGEGEGRHVHWPSAGGEGGGAGGVGKVQSRIGGAGAGAAAAVVERGRRTSGSSLALTPMATTGMATATAGPGTSPPSSFQSGTTPAHRSALSSSTSLVTAQSGTTTATSISTGGSTGTTPATSTEGPPTSPSPSPPATTSPHEKPLPAPSTAIVPSLPKQTSLPSPSNPTTASSSLHRPHLPHFHHGNAMVRHYTLQGAESGLGADYKKRKNVIRVRAEGEQFLLQADSLVDVVNWIEAFQAATNVALDLDQRPMPKIPTLPRRRRRRPRPSVDANGNPTPAAAGTGGSGAAGETQGNANAAEGERSGAHTHASMAGGA